MRRCMPSRLQRAAIRPCRADPVAASLPFTLCAGSVGEGHSQRAELRHGRASRAGVKARLARVWGCGGALRGRPTTWLEPNCNNLQGPVGSQGRGPRDLDSSTGDAPVPASLSSRPSPAVAPLLTTTCLAIESVSSPGPASQLCCRSALSHAPGRAANTVRCDA
jgi:hypothetical protein